VVQGKAAFQEAVTPVGSPVYGNVLLIVTSKRNTKSLRLLGLTRCPTLCNGSVVQPHADMQHTYTIPLEYTHNLSLTHKKSKLLSLLTSSSSFQILLIPPQARFSRCPAACPLATRPFVPHFHPQHCLRHRRHHLGLQSGCLWSRPDFSSVPLGLRLEPLPVLVRLLFVVVAVAAVVHIPEAEACRACVPVASKASNKEKRDTR